MKKTLLSGLLLLLVVACSTPSNLTKSKGHYYRFHYFLKEPIVDSSLVYNDDTLSIAFSINESQINFTIKNKLNDPIRIKWDDASLVINGETKKIIHKGIKYVDRNTSMPSSLIPGKAIWDDLVVPSDNIYYKEGYYGTYSSTPGSWQTKPLFPNQDLGNETLASGILLMKPEFSFFLPLQILSKDKYMSFTFKAKKVEQI
ncbi:hypothetical protein [Chitinophaga sancti]|uniref:Lipoprotein n=1 Tax=Chitinophaga sancti TaxID=1004 RepID=A0A1K1M4D6_9BACT|nr:hypothetical protein [Chitinophaga sancti]WQD64712.1 hypothetical protein U0033_09920 [Chitinophaga sancti]WQG89666.1 hypothetical protein SR876_32555 [Chitinophaga sancti]SFW16822.1 hypothetical protein SAMN05661012_00361 [Chitinophaga sancti]